MPDRKSCTGPDSTSFLITLIDRSVLLMYMDKMTVEVERKFICNAEIMGKLQHIGAKCIGQRQFQDQYFDSPDLILTLKDFWLRCRDGLWELKCPAVSGTTPDNETQALCSRYREITSFPLIQSEVRSIIRKHTAEGSESNSSQREQIDKVAENEDTEICSADDTKWLSDLNLICFAEFKTKRCSYMLERDGAVRVDLDQADFGYCVGEIEVLVPEGGDMNEAVQRITSTAAELATSYLLSDDVSTAVRAGQPVTHMTSQK